ncbi:MAG: UvrD-helicase domain-containing protein [Burkholderiales bacterium]|nr:UvrD-helicase domain-containing protein [Burkholderiales bacterium]
MSSRLNPMQSAAVRHIDGPLLVLAGAGSGKTRVITHKIAYLIEECGYLPTHIAAITFTNKAAKEMQDRVGKLLKGGVRGLTLSTFHSLGLAIVRSESSCLGLKKSFSILDSADSFGILASLCKTTDKKAIRQASSLISGWKNRLVAPGEAAAAAKNDEEHLAARIYADYQATLQAYQAVDFDDLIRLPAALFEQDCEALDRWRTKLRYLLIDEYQDTNLCQYRLIRQLAGSRGALTAVGDDDQAIYAWRGASTENLASLQTDYPNLEVIKLEQNYRSTVRILQAANSLISHNPKLFEKKLWSDLGHGEPIRAVAARDEEHEAESVVRSLLAHRFEHRGRYSDYAILYRGNHQARLFEQHLRNERVPYRISGGISFFDRSEIKDILAYLRLLVNPDDDPAFVRAVTTPKRGVGNQTLEALGKYAGGRHVSMFEAAFEAGLAHEISEKQLQPLLAFCNFINNLQFAAQRTPAGEIMNDLLKAIDFEAHLFDTEESRQAKAKWENVTEFASWIGKKSEEEEKSIIELAQTIALMNLIDRQDEACDEVQLSTLHAAKGLEFGHVFLVGVEEGILPHQESMSDAGIEEERRLMYVGVTRARESLHLSYCLKRKRAKELKVCEPSRFISELGDEIKFSGTAVTKEVGNAKLAMLKSALGNKSI